MPLGPTIEAKIVLGMIHSRILNFKDRNNSDRSLEQQDIQVLG